jgi:hypothetical protein
VVRESSLLDIKRKPTCHIVKRYYVSKEISRSFKVEFITLALPIHTRYCVIISMSLSTPVCTVVLDVIEEGDTRR